ncbi:uncharacterized protein N7529_001404 [Penicillium soppii]|jgi:hypothetical protein|uniref:uncharacterized protein n=1 Tax=Penicillium soppii TaxID=69789 RepID=UPI0025468593|nr:uncharacterized protein N7529_001404 [Penicillium soppii]KAJ5875820.1 hypothetical protein N7529_001404 [Penicillium soppii]
MGLDVYANTLNPESQRKRKHNTKRRSTNTKALSSCPQQPRSPAATTTPSLPFPNKAQASQRSQQNNLTCTEDQVQDQPPPPSPAPPQNMNTQTTAQSQPQTLNPKDVARSTPEQDIHFYGWSIRRLLSRRRSRRYSILEREPNRLRKRMSN